MVLVDTGAECNLVYSKGCVLDLEQYTVKVVSCDVDLVEQYAVKAVSCDV